MPASRAGKAAPSASPSRTARTFAAVVRRSADRRPDRAEGVRGCRGRARAAGQFAPRAKARSPARLRSQPILEQRILDLSLMIHVSRGPHEQRIREMPEQRMVRFVAIHVGSSRGVGPIHSGPTPNIPGRHPNVRRLAFRCRTFVLDRRRSIGRAAHRGHIMNSQIVNRRIGTAALVAMIFVGAAGCSSMRGSDTDSGSTASGSTSSTDSSTSGTSRRADSGSSTQAPSGSTGTGTTGSGSRTSDCGTTTGTARDPNCPPTSGGAATGSEPTTPTTPR
jgi:hypothetical protein